MSEPEDFLSRWSRRKREAEAASDSEAKPAVSEAAADEATVPASAPEETAFDVARLPSLESIVADTDVSVFMKAGVPQALRHAALRRAWTSDPAVRDFRGLQENDWDFTAPDSVPGFGTFKSEDEIKELAQRLFGRAGEPEPSGQVPSQDESDASVADARPSGDEILDKDQLPLSLDPSVACTDERTDALQQDDARHPEDRFAVQHVRARRHGGALPQ